MTTLTMPVAACNERAAVAAEAAEAVAAGRPRSPAGCAIPDDLALRLAEGVDAIGQALCVVATLATIDVASVTPDDVAVHVTIAGVTIPVDPNRLSFDSPEEFRDHAVAAASRRVEDLILAHHDAVAPLAAAIADLRAAEVQGRIGAVLGVHPERMAGHGPG